MMSSSTLFPMLQARNRSQRMSLRLDIDLRIFHVLFDDEGKPISAAEVATKSSVD